MGGAVLGAFVWGRADHAGGLGIDERLEHEAEHLTHQVTVISGAQHLGELEQGRLVQGHPLSPVLRVIRAFSQSLTRWPAPVPDDTPSAAEPARYFHHSWGLTPRRPAYRTIPAPRLSACIRTSAGNSPFDIALGFST